MQQNRNSIANARLFCIKLSIMLSTLAPTRSLINKAQVSTIVLCRQEDFLQYADPT